MEENKYSEVFQNSKYAVRVRIDTLGNKSKEHGVGQGTYEKWRIILNFVCLVQVT